MAIIVIGVVLWGLLVSAALGVGVRIMPDRPQCSPIAGDRCVQGDYSVDEYYYTVNGLHHMISFSEGGFYMAKCDAAGLGDDAFPSFARRQRFRRVTLTGCAPPPDASYADALAALNISVTERLTLRGLPNNTRLTAASFVGLSTLKALELSTYSTGKAIPLDTGVLEPLEALRSLVLVGVRPARLPKSLDGLRLRNTGLTALPAEALNVVTLEVVEEHLSDMGGPAPRLETLTLSAPVRAPPRAPKLKRASISRWAEKEPRAWSDCSQLELLSLTQAAAERLPADFIAACPKLHTLEFQLMQAEGIPVGFLRNASALRSFKAANWPLRELPPDLFDYSPDLQEVDLSNTGLESLPSGIFAPVVGSLRWLTLAHNALRARDVLTVAPLSELRVLNLSNNSLGDLCPATSANIVARSVSYLSGLRKLDQLVLSRTRATRVCADWTHHMHRLSRLDLTHNDITELQFSDLKIQREVSPGDVDVSWNPIRHVRCSRKDYELAVDDAIPKQTAKLIMDSLLECGCDAYYLARALRESRVLASFEPLCQAAVLDPPGRSIYKKPLRSVPLSSLVCELESWECAANCTCVLEPELGGLRIACHDVDYLRLDNLTFTDVPVKRVSATGVRHLPKYIPPSLELLDLDDGYIESASAERASSLFASGTRVRLTRNPLRCDACGHRALLDALAANQPLVLEYANMTCADNRSFPSAFEELTLLCAARRSYALGALVALACAALAAGALAALAARPEARLRVKAFLHSRGVRSRWLARRLEPRDGERRFDAFVAHAAADARFVDTVLARALEAGPRPLRLCLYYRDWPIGAWIPQQIQDSVKYSRRTVALVSPHFLTSQWARAELDEAHAAAVRERTSRLIIVLRDVVPAELDERLRSILAAHTTLRWGERAFWARLRYALPDPREPPAPPAASPDWPEPLGRNEPEPTAPPAAA